MCQRVMPASQVSPFTPETPELSREDSTNVFTQSWHLAFPGQLLAKGTDLEQFVLCSWGERPGYSHEYIWVLLLRKIGAG